MKNFSCLYLVIKSIIVFLTELFDSVNELLPHKITSELIRDKLFDSIVLHE